MQTHLTQTSARLHTYISEDQQRVSEPLPVSQCAGFVCFGWGAVYNQARTNLPKKDQTGGFTRALDFVAGLTWHDL